MPAVQQLKGLTKWLYNFLSEDSFNFWLLVLSIWISHVFADYVKFKI
jgi:hypothetical protein